MIAYLLDFIISQCLLLVAQVHHGCFELDINRLLIRKRLYITVQWRISAELVINRDVTAGGAFSKSKRKRWYGQLRTVNSLSTDVRCVPVGIPRPQIQASLSIEFTRI